MLANKVKLHGLERLDIIDAIDFQNLDNDFTAQINAGLIGACEGVTSSQSFGLTYANQTTDIMRLAPFKYVVSSAKEDTRELSQIPQGLIIDVAGVTSADKYNYVSVVSYDPSDEQNTIDISFDAVKADVQNYYNTNGELPPEPGTEEFVKETHTRYYPEILARPFFYNADQANRRFWSVANQTEQTQLVATRQRVASEIIVNPSHLKPQIGAGEELPWVKIGQITKWSVSADVVSLVLNKVIGYNALDSMLKLDAESVNDWAANTLQVKADGVISTLAHKTNEQINKILYEGSADSTEHAVGSAYYSLSEIKSRLESLETSAPQLIATATLFFDASLGYVSQTGETQAFQIVNGLSSNIDSVLVNNTNTDQPFSSGSINVSSEGLHALILPVELSTQYKVMSCTFTAAPANQNWVNNQLYASFNYRQMRQIQDSTFPLIWGNNLSSASLTSTLNDGRKFIKFYCAATDPWNEEASKNQQSNPVPADWQSRVIDAEGYLGNGLRQFCLIVNIYGTKI